VKILQVVTLVSPDGAFGGPVRVAESQAAALRERGHAVTMVAGTWGYGEAAPAEPGSMLFPARRILPTRGFSGTASLPLQLWTMRHASTFDVVHIHLARDLVTLPVAWQVRRAGVPYVIQPQGMIDEPDHPLAAPLDALLTRRILRDAGRVLYLRPVERRSLERVSRGRIRLQLQHNAVPAQEDIPDRPTRPEVLFLSRLHPRKRPMAFVDVARSLLDEGVDASFVLVGPDEGEGPAVRQAVAEVGDPGRLRWEGPVDRRDVLARIGRSSFMVMPAIDEPYATVILEALSLGRAVVLLDDNGLAPEVEASGCGLVVDRSAEQLVGATRRLLADPLLLDRLSTAALRASREHFSLATVAAQLETLYTEVIATHV
jgi:glycosyltransferase involved in cell wall biosynthesis